MADFLKAFLHTSGHEGGYANDPDDFGGETYRGIARTYHEGWYGWEIIDSYKDDPNFPEILDLDDDLAFRVEQFYKDRYWDVNSLDDIDDQELAFEVYDTGVNMGTSRAAKFLQEALNLTNRRGKDYPDIAVDGKVGPATLRTANQHNRTGNVIKTMNIMQGYHYIEQCRKNPSQEKYFNGWLNRVSL